MSVKLNELIKLKDSNPNNTLIILVWTLSLITLASCIPLTMHNLHSCFLLIVFY